MRPTFSILFFTVLSGAGYGLLFLLGLGLAFDALPVSRIVVAIVLAAGALLATAGLLASVGHLGKPLRAWRAFSQWRSSWLSREGVVSTLTYLPMVAIAASLALNDTAQTTGALRIAGVFLAIGCAATVFCTGNIYASLKPIRAWHNVFVVPGYLLLGLHSGALCFVALADAFGGDSARSVVAFAFLADALLIAPVCAGFKWRYWRWLDASAATPDIGSATGLDRLGIVRRFEQPHTEENYLTHEMGFVLARRHARVLRAIAFWMILIAPITMLLLGRLLGNWTAWPALGFVMLGVFVERWLFFAEARHAVIAFYGR